MDRVLQLRLEHALRIKDRRMAQRWARLCMPAVAREVFSRLLVDVTSLEAMEQVLSAIELPRRFAVDFFCSDMYVHADASQEKDEVRPVDLAFKDTPMLRTAYKKIKSPRYRSRFLHETIPRIFQKKEEACAPDAYKEWEKIICQAWSDFQRR